MFRFQPCGLHQCFECRLRPRPSLLNYSHLHAFFNHLDPVTNVCKMDNHPPARRPHKSPAHTVKDRRNRPQRLVSCSSPKCRASRTLYSSFRERQHLSAKLFAASRLAVRFIFPKLPSHRAAHLTACFRLVNTYRNRRFLRPANLTNQSAGRASYSNVSDRQHLSKPLFLRVPADRYIRSTGPRIMHT